MSERKFMTRIGNWLFFLLLLVLQSISTFANNNNFAPFQSGIKVSGRVSQSDGSPLAGATVSVKEGSQSVSTDKNGHYTITVPNGNTTLIVSFVGYTQREIAVGNQSEVNVTLQSSAGELTNVVVMGYGSQRKRDVTGAVKSLKAEDFNRGVVTSPQQLIQGKAAGVNVTSSSGEPGAP
ncbi:MAG TPA: carboxypeptidase-like regulatory domain-containing protein, partial [Puia sp.]